MQAPKNGFFYVIDRETGKFISAKPYVSVNWASGIDPVTGRPIENPETRVDKTGKPALVTPGALRRAQLAPDGLPPGEGLVYIPAFEAGMMYAPEADWKPDTARGFNVGFDHGAGDLPADDGGFSKRWQARARASLIAWDPVAQKRALAVEHPGPWNGGLLATGGGLVFQGTRRAVQRLCAATASELWSFAAQTGWSPRRSPTPSMASNTSRCWPAGAGPGRCRWRLISRKAPVPNISRLLVFKLGGTAKLPPAPRLGRPPARPAAVHRHPAQSPQAPMTTAATAVSATAMRRSARPCCPTSGAAPCSTTETWMAIVHDGALKHNGMVSFSPSLSRERIEAVRQYVIFRANEDKQLGAAQGFGRPRR
jgi:quinohemoprotein ethanol dehydrogenase